MLSCSNNLSDIFFAESEICLINKKENSHCLENIKVEDVALSVFANQGGSPEGASDMSLFSSPLLFSPEKTNIGDLDSRKNHCDQIKIDSPDLDFPPNLQNPIDNNKVKEEDTRIYSIPKTKAVSLTPDKYYPFIKRSEEKIVLQLTPGLEERINNLAAGVRERPDFIYFIKNKENDKRYIGATNDPRRRALEHARKATEHNPKSRKYKPYNQTGYLYREMGRNPENFIFGVLNIPLEEKIPSTQKDDFNFVKGIRNVEKDLINLRESLHNQKGYNANIGGGGPIGRPSSKRKASSQGARESVQTSSTSGMNQLPPLKNQRLSAPERLVFDKD